MASPDNPFSTCLVGVPDVEWPCPSTVLGLCSTSTYVDNWDGIVPHLPQAPLEPQELEILGSLKADHCVMFNYISVQHSQNFTVTVNATSVYYQNTSNWCSYTSTSISRSSTTPIALPSGLFLICGDRAWPGIPSHLKGGPCTIGRLTLLTANNSMILNITRRHRQQKRSSHAFTKDCDSNADFWSLEQRVAASLLAPGVAAAQALATLNKLGCWLAKQTNATSSALSELLLDVDSVRHATLQNRAAIDFLLLAHGHGCQDFDGMCCMNLSSHSKSIHAHIQELERLTKQLQENSGWGLEDWLRSLGFGPWITSLIKLILIGCLVCCALLIMLPCFCVCLQRMINNTVQVMFKQTLLVAKEKGGIVDDFLEDRGHGKILELYQQGLGSSRDTLVNKFEELGI
ncbi:syncytin-1-like [Nyctibius grandis]|uniref:syncytin-1-like n=1 Tax=Nyctibius grandis TaxID=48427 RepID=UPI0035BC6712